MRRLASPWLEKFDAAAAEAGAVPAATCAAGAAASSAATVELVRPRQRTTPCWLAWTQYGLRAAMPKADVAAAGTAFAGASKNAAPTGAPPAADVAAGAATSAGAPKTAPTEQATAPKDTAETKKSTYGALRFQWKRVAVTRNAAAARGVIDWTRDEECSRGQGCERSSSWRWSGEKRMICSPNSPSLDARFRRY